MKKIEFKFLKDVPIDENTGELFGFYHSNIAPALKDILESQTCVHTIALFGEWGTGKSTIVKLVKQDSDKDTCIIEFDCWKYEKDSLRRQLLLQLANDLGLGKKYLDKLEKDFYFSLSETISEKLVFSWPRLGKAALISLPLVAIPALFVWRINPNIVVSWKSFLGALIPSWAALGLLYDKVIGDDLRNIVMISPTSGIKNRLDSPELFEKSFAGIVKKANGHQKIVIVVDNLDRVDQEVAREVLSTLKTFLEIDDNSLAGKSIVFLVPCDFAAIQKVNIDGTSDEFLRKIFNVTIWTPEFINTDLQSFTLAELGKTGAISTFIDTEDVALVINSAFSSNPRQIKQFINNIIAAVITASKTDVWEDIQKNIPYLAKVLVLRQEFPEVYKQLKEKWADPQNITGAEDNTKLREFMLKTSTISVPDAEPYLYFKQPVISKQLTNSNDIRIELIKGDRKQSAALIAKESNKNAVADFISLLLSKYQSQPEALLNIFTTQLEVFRSSKIPIDKKGYYSDLAKAINNNLWQNYLKLPTELIFEDLLANKLLDQGSRDQILERYIQTLTSNELKSPQNLSHAQIIISCFVKYKELLNKEAKVKIAHSVEEGFITFIEIATLFQTEESQQAFVTKEAFQKLVNTVEQKNIAPFKPILLGFRGYLLKNGLVSLVIQRLVDLLQFESSQNPDSRSEKDHLVRFVTEILLAFENELTTLSDNLKQQLISDLTQTLNGISEQGKRWVVIPALHTTFSLALPEKQTEITREITTTLSVVSANDLRSLLNSFKENKKEGFITQYLDTLLPRFVSETELLEIVYESANNSQKLQMIKYLVDHKDDQGMAFISAAGEMSGKTEVTLALLHKAQTMPAPTRVQIYAFLSRKIKRNDTEEVKNLVTSQIKELLITDDQTSSEVGYNFLITAPFLSEEKKREIAKEVLEFIRQAGKVLTGSNQFSLRSISFCFAGLQDTIKRDFIYVLFDNLKDDRDGQTLEVVLGILNEIRPTFTAHSKDYQDLLERLKLWPENENRLIILQKITALSSPKPSKGEKTYWMALGALSASNKEI